MSTNEKLPLKDILEKHAEIIRQISSADLNKLMIKEIRITFDDKEYFERVEAGENTGDFGFCDEFYKRKIN